MDHDDRWSVNRRLQQGQQRRYDLVGAVRVFAAGTRTAEGYPAPQPTGGTLDTPSAAAVEDIFPAVDVSSIGHVYFGSYRGNSVSPVADLRGGTTTASGPHHL